MSDIDEVRRRARISKIFINLQADKDESKKRRIEYITERDAKKASNDGLREDKAREVLRKVTSVQDDCVDHIIYQTTTMKDNLVEYIKQELGYDKGAKVEFYQLEEIVNEMSSCMKQIKRIANDKTILNKKNSNLRTIYESLFFDLINLDARFAVFAPAGAMTTSTIKQKIQRLPECFRADIEKTQKRLKKNPKADYLALYQVPEFEENNPHVAKAKELMQPVRKEIVKSITQMMKATKQLSEDIYNHFVEQLEVYKDKNGRVPDEKIKAIAALMKPAKNKLNELSRNVHICKKATWEGDIVENLLERLQLLDPRIEFEDLTNTI